jgi:hypothetical protein
MYAETRKPKNPSRTSPRTDPDRPTRRANTVPSKLDQACLLRRRQKWLLQQWQWWILQIRRRLRRCCVLQARRRVCLFLVRRRRWRWRLPRQHRTRGLAADRAEHRRLSAKPLVDAFVALVALAAVEHMVARERANHLEGVHALLADGAVVAQLPLQGGDAAERRDAQPPPPCPQAVAVGVRGADAPGDDEGSGDAHDQGDDGRPGAHVVGHGGCAPLALSCFLPLLLSLSLDALPFLLALSRRSWMVRVGMAGHWCGGYL